MRGDTVEVLADWGARGPHRYVIRATRLGRRLEVTAASGVFEVREVMRTGRVVWTLRFPTERVIHVLEHDGSAAGSATFEIARAQVDAEPEVPQEAASREASAVVTSEAVPSGVRALAPRPAVPDMTAAGPERAASLGDAVLDFPKGSGGQGKSGKGKRGSPRKRPGGKKR